MSAIGKLLEMARIEDSSFELALPKTSKQLPYMMGLDKTEGGQESPQSSFSVKNRVIRGRRTTVIEGLRLGNMLDFKIRQYAAGLDVIGEQMQGLEQ